jgi:hypothetical protein
MWKYIILFILLAPVVFAGPPPSNPGLAINEQSQECGFYQSFDGKYEYAVPEGWEVYQNQPYETARGICRQSILACCEAFNLTYQGNIGVQEGDRYAIPNLLFILIFYLLPVALVVLVVWIIVTIIKKKRK